MAVTVKAEESLSKSTGMKVTFRTHAAVERFFAGTELVEPGVVAVEKWRATDELDLGSATTAMWGGLGRKG